MAQCAPKCPYVDYTPTYFFTYLTVGCKWANQPITFEDEALELAFRRCLSSECFLTSAPIFGRNHIASSARIALTWDNWHTLDWCLDRSLEKQNLSDSIKRPWTPPEEDIEWLEEDSTDNDMWSFEYEALPLFT